MSDSIFRGLTTRVQRNVLIDGIDEISTGLWVTVMGAIAKIWAGYFLGSLMSVFFLGICTAWILFFTSKYLKRTYSHSRLGYVKPGPIPFFPYGLIGLIIYLPIAFFALSRVETQPWTIMYVLWTVQSTNTGIVSRAPRFFLYAALAGALLWLNVTVDVFFLTTGVVWLVMGCIVFLKFLRTYPIIDEESINA